MYNSVHNVLRVTRTPGYSKILPSGCLQTWGKHRLTVKSNSGLARESALPEPPGVLSLGVNCECTHGQLRMQTWLIANVHMSIANADMVNCECRHGQLRMYICQLRMYTCQLRMQTCSKCKFQRNISACLQKKHEYVYAYNKNCSCRLRMRAAGCRIEHLAEFSFHELTRMSDEVPL
jgi:hypothetical protein